MSGVCGTRSRYVNHGCRCDQCRAANTEYKRSANAARAGRVPPEGVAHGTVSTYTNWCCRCVLCRQAQCAAMREQRRVRLAAVRAGSPAVPHGTASGYEAWGCRCTSCCTAASGARRAYRTKAKANAIT